MLSKIGNQTTRTFPLFQLNKTLRKLSDSPSRLLSSSKQNPKREKQQEKKMGRRKNNQNSMSLNNAQHQATKICFNDDEEEENSNLDDSIVATEKAIAMDDVTMSDPNGSFVDGGDDDNTSADYYFDSYSHFGIHEEMLKDVVRTKTYQNVIFQNKFLFKDKIVLDVGAGTGILSLFCAKAGAAHVYAVECSHIANMAKEIVESNGYSNVITVLKGKIEDIELPVAKVDIIISEWMGYFLLFENMLNSVLYTRDKWLANDGIVLPDKASLYLTAIEDAEYKEDKIEFWKNVYGFDMTCIKKQAMGEPLVDTVDQNQIVTNCQLLKTMDISKMASGDTSFTVPFKLVAERDDYIHALVAYFDVSFTKCHKLMGFSTGPRSRATHWKQTVLYLEDVLTICQGEALTGSMTVAPNKKNPRDIDITIKYSLNGQRCVASRTQHYKMR
ncbi:protein arginine N-methyltransferase [Salix suchowensis]|nr:protein arginine N-methyltransferase [Salix suchowensis]